MALANVIAPPLQVEETALTPDYTLSINKIRRYGNMVTITMATNVNIQPNSNSWVRLGVIPEGFRPDGDWDFAGSNNKDDTYIHVRVSGSYFSFYGFAGKTYNPYITITYIIP